MTTDQVPFARQVPYNLEGHLTPWEPDVRTVIVLG
jgi:hypothetical protein